MWAHKTELHSPTPNLRTCNLLHPHFKYWSPEDSLDVCSTSVEKPRTYQVDFTSGTSTNSAIHTIASISIFFANFFLPIATTNNNTVHFSLTNNITIIADCLDVFSLVHRIRRISTESDEAVF